jgi:hypothetical protein
MRCRSWLLSACLGLASGAQAVEVEKLTIATELDPRGQLVGLESLDYPGRTGQAYFHVLLKGLEPGRRYTARFVVTDGRPNTLYDEAAPFVPSQSTWGVWRAFSAPRRAEPGEWRFTFRLDGLVIGERIITATRRPLPPVEVAPALQTVRALLTSSLSRNKEPRRPLERLGIPSAAFYYVEAKGFVPGRNYQVRVVVLDGAQRAVVDGNYSMVPSSAQYTHWVPVILGENHAPGRWTFRLFMGWSAPAPQLVAETHIDAAPGAARAKDDYLERHLPLLAAALLMALAYVGYGLYAYNAGAVTAPPPRPLFDPALLALLTANFLPLGAAYYGGANAADLLIVYWSENLVIAAYTLLRMIRAHKPDEGNIVVGLLMFIGMFGVFCTVHGGAIVWLLFDHSSLLMQSPHWLGPATAAEFDRLAGIWDLVPAPFVWLMGALFISHGVSFVQNFLRRGEFLRSKASDEMMRPFSRIMIMHIASTASGVFALSHGSPLIMLALVVLVKTGADVYAHLVSHGLLPKRRPSFD